MSSLLRSVPLVLVLLLGACGDSTPPSPPVSATSPGAASGPAQAGASVEPHPPADACRLLTIEDVEAAGGRKAMPPRGEQMAELSTCAWGDPESPLMGDRPLESVVEISVFSGGNGYYAGPLAQAREVFSMERRNAMSDEAVSGLGEDAYWDGSELHVLRAPYAIGVEVNPVSREAAEVLARAALARLP